MRISRYAAHPRAVAALSNLAFIFERCARTGEFRLASSLGQLGSKRGVVSGELAHSGAVFHSSSQMREGLQKLNVIKQGSCKSFGCFRMLFPRPAQDRFEIG